MIYGEAFLKNKICMLDEMFQRNASKICHILGYDNP